MTSQQSETTKGIINTIILSAFQPELEKIKNWALQRKIADEISPEKLFKSIETYLLSLATQVSEITSIAFPHEKLKIDKAYEPLDLEFKSSEESSIDADHFIASLSKPKSNFIIIDEAGMGKTTFSKYIIGKLLFKQSRIPIFFELRKITQNTDLLENIAKEINLPGKELHKELFHKLLEAGKFIIILDGFDEIPPENQERYAKEIHEISFKTGGNSLIVTSRPQGILPKLSNGRSLKIKGLSTQKATSLILKYDAICKKDIGQKLAGELDKVPGKFIESPLLMSLLYRTYAINGSIADKAATFYDEIYSALYKGHDLINKDGYSRIKKSKLSFEDFRRLLRSLCYYMLIKRKVSFNSWSEAINFIDEASSLCSIKPNSSSDFLEDLLSSVPLMTKDGSDFKFSHKTILEYFAAEYIVYNEKSTILTEKILSSPLAPSLGVVFDFLSEINPSLYERTAAAIFAQILSKSNSNDQESLILETHYYLNITKIGIWTKSGNSYETKTGEYIFHPNESLEPTTDMEISGNITTWCEIKIGEVEYYVSISKTSLYENLFEKTWVLLSDALPETNYTGSLLEEDGAQILKYLKVNTWNKISFSLIENLSKNIIIKDLAVRFLPFGQLGRRIISPIKSKALLEKINNERLLEEKLNDLL